jgi:hypothetical protein
VPAPAITASGRIKTQWTGNLSIPELEAGPPPRSRLPMIIGAIALVAGAAVAASYVATRGGTSSGSGSASSGGSQGATSTPTPPAPPAPPTPPVLPAAAAGAPPLTFQRAHVRLASVPPGAAVKDLASGAVIGQTPVSFDLAPSREPRQFALSRKGYGDAVIELVPDQEAIERTATMARGEPASQADNHKVPDPGGRSTPGGGSARSKPEPASGNPEPGKPTGTPGSAKAGSAAPPGPARPDDDSIEPVLKADPSRAGSGSGSGP